MISAISRLPGADIKLNSHSLQSYGFLPQLLQQVYLQLSPGLLERILKNIQIFNSKKRALENPLLLNVSHFPAKIIIFKQIAILNSSTLNLLGTGSSILCEYQIITQASNNQRPTNIKSQAADSLNELSQTCAMCVMTEIKPSHEFSDQVLHSKQPRFPETFKMNSAILASCYALMGTQTITSGHSVSSHTKVTL